MHVGFNADALELLKALLLFHGVLGYRDSTRGRDISDLDRFWALPLVFGLLPASVLEQVPSRTGQFVPLVADLSGVTQLASAGVRALYEVSKQLAAHGQKLTLVTARGSVAHLLLDLVRLDHVTAEEGA